MVARKSSTAKAARIRISRSVVSGVLNEALAADGAIAFFSSNLVSSARMLIARRN